MVKAHAEDTGRLCQFSGSDCAVLALLHFGILGILPQRCVLLNTKEIHCFFIHFFLMEISYCSVNS